MLLEVLLRPGAVKLLRALAPVSLLLMMAAQPESRAADAPRDEWDEVNRAPAAVDQRYPFLAETPVRDQRLKNRLTERKVYVSRPGDTLRKVAHLLYGHKTWWKKVKADNKHFLSYRPDDILPPGKTIHIRVPKIGKEYVVQKDDWLIRIAQWKYGKTDFWQELYRKNKDRIQDPDLIHPGDRLRFRKDGTIRVAGSNKVVVSGVKSREKEALKPANPKEAEEFDFDDKPAAQQPAAEPSPPEEQPSFGTRAEDYGKGASLEGPPVTADPWRNDKPAGTEVADGQTERGPSSEVDDPWWASWPARGFFIILLLAMLWAFFAYARSSDLILYPKRGFRGYAFDRKPPKPTRGPYDDLSLDEDFLDESNIDRIDIRPRPNYQSLWKTWLRKRVKRLRKNSDS